MTVGGKNNSTKELEKLEYIEELEKSIGNVLLEKEMNDTEFVKFVRNMYEKHKEWIPNFFGNHITIIDGKVLFKDSSDTITKIIDDLFNQYVSKKDWKGLTVLISTLKILCKTKREDFKKENNIFDEVYIDIKGKISKTDIRIIVEYILNELKRRGILETFIVGGDLYAIKYVCLYKKVGEKLLPILEDYEKKYLELEKVNSLSTEDAIEEYFNSYLPMIRNFELYLKKTLLNEEKLKEIKKVNLRFIVEKLKEHWGGIYFEPLLTLAHQASLGNFEIVTPENVKKISTTLFSVARFGAPGTGKSFFSRDFVVGSENENLPAHGIPFINKVVGGITAAEFLCIGEAYQDRIINFIVPEFAEWFKKADKSIVERLKLALERGIISFQSRMYSVKPYKFNSVFSVNYNVKYGGKNYQYLLKDPNFSAIEDRMICRLNLLTDTMYENIVKSMEALIFADNKEIEDRNIFAENVRNFLSLCYAIGNGIIDSNYKKKKILITKENFEKIKELDKEIRNAITNIYFRPINKEVLLKVSPRLIQKTIKLIASLSLFNYFDNEDDLIKIDDLALKIGMRFYLDEFWVRSDKCFEIYDLIRKFGLDLWEIV